ncbi:MAG: protein kinase, partial [Verrucomicrobiales bacterium]|nr:protein kinase [Verrucomicrobiales bacterium]
SEARAVAALDHPGIIPIYEVGEHDSRPFFAMRLVRGGSLASGALRSGLDVRRGAEIVARIARAVHHAHQRGVLHRDLKPANILVDAGEPMVADFGLAKRLGEASDAGATATGAVIGSPAYMAPEQAAGKTRDISTASDVYSLGAILYELLSGEPPFRADTPLATLRLVTETEPAPLRGRGRAIDRNLETICLKCLAKLPRDRYGSAEAVAEDLERWLRRESIQARRVPFWERGWNWTRRHPNLALAVVAVTATAATGLAAFLGQFRRTQEALEQARATALAERSARAAVIAPERTWNFASEVRVATPSPDGTRLLVASGTNAHVLALPSGEPLASFVGHTGSVRIARWSGDGRRVLTVSTCQEQPVWDDPNGPYGDGTIRVWDASNGGAVAHMDNPLADIVMSAAISRDGRLVAIGAVHGQAAWWKPDADEAPTLWDAFDVQIRGLDFDARDRYLVATPGDLVTWIRRPMPNGGSFGHIGFHAETPARLFALGSTQEIGSVQPVTRMRMRHWEIVHAKPRPIETTRAVAAFAPDGEWFVTGGSHPPNTAIWSSPDARLLHRLSGHTQAVSCVAISRDGSRVATGGEDRAVHVRDARSGHLLGRLGPHPRNVRYIEFAPEMRWALTVCADQKIRIWDVEEGVCVALLRGHNGPVHEAHFVDDGERVVSASADRTLRLWRWATFEQMAQGLDGHATEIRSAAFDPAGRHVAAGAFDGTARVWDIERGRGRPVHLLDPGPDYGVGCEATIRANGGGQMRGVAFSADGSRLVTARTDPVFSRTVDLSVLLRSRWIARTPSPLPWTPGRVWDVVSGRAVGVLGATNLAFAGVSLAPDGKSLLFLGDAMPRQASRRGIWRFEESSYSHGYGR